MQAKEPNIKSNPNSVEIRQCAICKTFIADHSHDMFLYSRNNEAKPDSIMSSYLCKACAAEECPQNYKHEVKLLNNGKHFCKKCKKIVEDMPSYLSHLKEHDIKVDEAKLTYI